MGTQRAVRLLLLAKEIGDEWQRVVEVFERDHLLFSDDPSMAGIDAQAGHKELVNQLSEVIERLLERESEFQKMWADVQAGAPLYS